MQRVRGIGNLNLNRSHTVLTIGNFDGVHQGHQAILRQVMDESRKSGGPSAVYTFRPHPQEVLRPGVAVKLLTSYDEKSEIFEALGIDIHVEEPFSQDFFSMSAREFFERVIRDGFHARTLFVGHDFAFGRNREGSIETLAGFCAEEGIELRMIHEQRLASGESISSTEIRRVLQAGEVAHAQRMLGRYFFYRGIVVKGDQRGRLLGFPTANLRIENKLALPHGVYATWALLRRAGQVEKYPSVTNVGVRPTFHPGELDLPALVETHLILAEGVPMEIYGESLEVQFVDRFRDERRFTSFEELKLQIARDKQQAKEFFGCVS